MDTKPSEVFTEEFVKEWKSWKSKVHRDLFRAGHKYCRGGKIVAVHRDRRWPHSDSDFGFIQNDQVKALIQRDCLEIKQAVKARCWKSAIILSGGVMEAALLDAISSNTNRSSLRGLSFEKLIDKAVDLRLVTPAVNKLSHSVRQYRNLVHLEAEMDQGLSCDQGEADIACDILRLVWRDLSASRRTS
jgi:hypothetical protein